MNANRYTERAAQRRAVRRARALLKVREPISQDRLSDPLSMGEEQTADRRFIVVACVASLLLHGALLVAAAFLPSTAGNDERDSGLIEVSFFEPEPEPEPPPIEKMKPRPAPRFVRPKPDPMPLENSPPPDPTDIAPQVIEEPKKPVRRVIGLSMASTVQSGAGLAFAVGNTRLGQTAKVAEDPRDVGDLADEVVLPKRIKAPKPKYPPTLRSKGIEGDVGLELEIDRDGRVARVEVILPSAFGAFDEAAVDAARRSTYEPAIVNGVAIRHAIRFTVRFRLRG